MAMREDTSWKRRVFNELKAIGGVWKTYPRSRYVPAGTPDIIGCFRGRAVAIELKAPGGKHPVTDAQKFALAEWGMNGGLSFIVDSKESLQKMIEVLENE